MRLFSALLALLVAGSLAAPARAAENLDILLDWFVNPDHAPLVVAKEKGFFAQQGLEVTLIAPADPSAPPRLVAAGKGDVAVNYQPQLQVQVAEGLPLTRIGTLIATPLNCLMVLRDGPIKSIADLAGGKIGFSVGGFDDALLGTMLRRNGVDPAGVELVNVNFSLSPSLYAGQVDAVIGAYRNFELNQMDIDGRPGRCFFVEEEGVPPYDELVLTVRNDRIDDARFVRMLNALEQATQYLINHPDAAWELFIKAYPELDDELNRRAWKDTLTRFALRPAALDTRRYRRFAAYLRENGLVTALPPVSDYAVELN